MISHLVVLAIALFFVLGVRTVVVVVAFSAVVNTGAVTALELIWLTVLCVIANKE
jgi:hypothetical protein